MLDNFAALSSAAKSDSCGSAPLPSVPPLRLAALGDVLANPYSRTGEVAKRLQTPRRTTDRALQELQLVGLLQVEDATDGHGWRYYLRPEVDSEALQALMARKVSTPGVRVEKESPPACLPPDISGHREPDRWAS